jgi:hypothetical protein
MLFDKNKTLEQSGNELIAHKNELEQMKQVLEKKESRLRGNIRRFLYYAFRSDERYGIRNSD